MSTAPPPSNALALTWGTAALLTLPPLMWAGNAVVGRLAADWIPPFTLNLLRWTLAFALLLPFAWAVLRPGSGLWGAWRRFALLGLLGVGGYNTLQYLALHTSTPLNVTLVASSTPVWMLLLGRLFYGVPLTRGAVLGAALSLAGVLLVLSQGQPAQLLHLRLVPGDAWMLLAALVWAWYSWLLARPQEPTAIRGDWSAFLLGQMVFGLMWSTLSTTGEWLWHTQASTPPLHIAWGWPLAAVLLFVAVGPSLLAYRCWGAGVRRAGPTLAGFFANLTPLFAALMSAAFLGETPGWHHGAAFALIVGGIWVSKPRA